MNNLNISTELVKSTYHDITPYKERKDDYIDGLGDLMNNTQFREFLKEYGNDWDNIKMIVMMIKMYEFIEEIYLEKINGKPSRDDIVMMMRIIMKTPVGRDIRKSMIEGVNAFEKGKPFRNVIKDHIELYIDKDINNIKQIKSNSK